VSVELRTVTVEVRVIWLDQVLGRVHRDARGCVAANCPSFDHLIGAGEQRGRHGETERFRRLEIDYQFQPGALLNRDVSRLRTLEDFSSVNPHLLS
jgi:hypothetical protein